MHINCPIIQFINIVASMNSGPYFTDHISLLEYSIVFSSIRNFKACWEKNTSL